MYVFERYTFPFILWDRLYGEMFPKSVEIRLHIGREAFISAQNYQNPNDHLVSQTSVAWLNVSTPLWRMLLSHGS